jgi:hypothetical protein
MVIPASDPEPDSTPDVTPDPVLGDDPSSTVERTDPRAVLADWFDDTAESIGDLVDELVAAYETDEGHELTSTLQPNYATGEWEWAWTPSSDELSEIAVETVRRYLRNREAKPGRTDPRQAMTDWFSLADAHQELPQPFTMLTVAFETERSGGSTSAELAQIVLAAVQRYLRDYAPEADE